MKTMNAYLIPEEAVGHDQRGSYLLTVNGQYIVQRLAVKTGPLIGKERAIIEGLSGKEQVVVKGMQRAVPGRKVTAQGPGRDKKGAP
ncbi:MAG: hypothetical protein EG828_15635 [Deltaproteobacteria bacterium]|nr:hypothetical protein [Deltaproteobacteria bacterium]